MANSKIIKDYLDKNDVDSLLQSYNVQYNTDYSIPSDDIKNIILNKIHQEFILNSLLSYFDCKIMDVNIIGRGTQGYVISLPSIKMKECIDNFSNVFVTEREKKININIPNRVAIKIQLLYTKNKFWEERILKEEFILNKLSTINDIKNYIPKFYYGCTINFNALRIRLTFMELIDPSRFLSLRQIIETDTVSEEIYNNIKNVVKLFWKYGVTHNDLSINNILFNRYDGVKIVDFGLAEMIKPNQILDEKTYQEYFENVSKNSQNGSNVTKLRELFSFTKNK